MDSIKINIKFWLAGLIAGVILVERWRRRGGRSVSVTVEPASQTTTLSLGKPKASTSILTGAKEDAERVRRLLGRPTSAPTDTVDSPSPA